jgi:hypothetical protein
MSVKVYLAVAKAGSGTRIKMGDRRSGVRANAAGGGDAPLLWPHPGLEEPLPFILGFEEQVADLPDGAFAAGK